MKISARKLLVFCAIVLTFSAIQIAWADELAVTGTIDRIGDSSIDVVEDDGTIYTFYHIPMAALEAAQIYLAVGDTVTVSSYVVTFPNAMLKYIAYTITKGGVTYSWHPNEPKARPTDAISATGEYAGSNCPGCDPISNDYDYNHDYNYNYLEPGPHKK